jgi:hypothetical protein
LALASGYVLHTLTAEQAEQLVVALARAVAVLEEG